jgi:2-phospho-L-lactate guanylyltransferase (CobY/MobA/RfbA family)
LGISGITLGLVIGLKADLDTDEDLVAYILFGFGLFTLLVAILGVWKRNREYLRVVRV